MLFGTCIIYSGTRSHKPLTHQRLFAKKSIPIFHLYITSSSSPFFFEEREIGKPNKNENRVYCNRVSLYSDFNMGMENDKLVMV